MTRARSMGGGRAQPVAAQAVELADLAATARFAVRIAAVLRPGDVIALSGSLGAGKTTLTRAILVALGYSGEVPSPSFSIVELYEPPGVRLPVVHADFYRLTGPAEVAEIGLDDYRQGAVLIAEWPERAGGFTHEAACLSITLEISVGNKHRAIVEAGADWLMRNQWMGL